MKCHILVNSFWKSSFSILLITHSHYSMHTCRQTEIHTHQAMNKCLAYIHFLLVTLTAILNVAITQEYYKEQELEQEILFCYYDCE